MYLFMYLQYIFVHCTGNGAKKKCPPNCLRPKSQTCKSRYETNGCPYNPNDFTEMVKPVSAKPMVSRVPQKTGQGVGPQVIDEYMPCHRISHIISFSNQT